MQRKIQGYILLFIAIALFISGLMLNSYYSKNSVFMCSLVEQNPSISMEDCPAHNSSHIYYVAIILAIGFAAFFFSIYFLMSYDLIKSKSFNKKIIFNDEEKLVINYLTVKEGSAYQSEIAKHADFTKVKTTRILDKLEGKGIIERKRRGMTNIVILRKGN